MPAKLILSLDGQVLNEYRLNKERTTIGRKPRNDIVIDNLAISNEHAAIITILNDSFLEDLESTNGLSVNGVVTKKHFLQNNDVIEIGKYKLKYLNEQAVMSTQEDLGKASVTSRPENTAPASGNGEAKKTSTIQSNSTQPQQIAALQILNGSNLGKEIELVKGLTTLGKPGVQVAVLARRPNGFFITHVEGGKFPLVNGESIGEHPLQLHDHDLIELLGVKMEFYFKAQ